MALAIRDTNSPPPERFHFPIPQTGFDVDAGSYNQLFENIHQHCVANNIPEPDRQTVIDFLCNNTHVPCYDDHTRIPLVNAFTMSVPVPTRSCCGGKSK